MAYAVLLLQENLLFRLNAGETRFQPQSQAVNISAYRYVVPVVHVRTSTDNVIGSDTAVTFNFLTAAALPTQFDVKPPGTYGNRFIDLDGGTVAINQTFTGTTEGKSFSTAQLTDGGFKAIVDPGALILWKCANKSAAAVSFWADVYLVCRGDG
jgi:hypothetical protein